MTDDQRPKLLTGDQLAPGQSLRDATARLEALRVEGERLAGVAASDDSRQGTLGRWRRQWEASLEAVQALCQSQAPLQFEMISWPSKVDGAVPPSTLAGLMRMAATGTRELRLLAAQLVDIRPGGNADAQPQDAPVSDEMSNIGTSYFRSGQRFEGAVEIRRLIQKAKRSIRVVDPYITEETFVLANAADPRVSRQFLMQDHRSTLTNAVRDAWTKWAGDWSQGGAECRAVGSARLPHSRHLFVDGATYHFDASLKDFGHRFTHFRLLLEPSEVRVVEGEVATAWAAAVPL